jgi:hypothetical protein
VSDEIGDVRSRKSRRCRLGERCNEKWDEEREKEQRTKGDTRRGRVHVSGGEGRKEEVVMLMMVGSPAGGKSEKCRSKKRGCTIHTIKQDGRKKKEDSG